jgi:hypothetical protein
VQPSCIMLTEPWDFSTGNGLCTCQLMRSEVDPTGQTTYIAFNEDPRETPSKRLSLRGGSEQSNRSHQSGALFWQDPDELQGCRYRCRIVSSGYDKENIVVNSSIVTARSGAQAGLSRRMWHRIVWHRPPE